MNEWLPNKLKWMSFVVTWAEVCIYSWTDRWSPGVYDFVASFQSHIAGLFYFAVSLFFLISGFVFVEPCEQVIAQDNATEMKILFCNCVSGMPGPLKTLLFELGLMKV